MRVLIDGQAPQSDPDRWSALPGLLAELHALRPGWRVGLVTNAHLPPVQNLPAHVEPIVFVPPASDPDINGRFFADWLLALGPDLLLTPHAFKPGTVVPLFADRRPRRLGLLAGPPPAPHPSVARSLRHLADSDAVLTLGANDTAFRIARNATAPIARSRTRLAWVSPVPPNPSGIADYSADLLEPLSERYDIELIVDPDRPEVDAGLAARHRVVAADEAFARHSARPYDLFVYHLGDHPSHAHMLGLMARFRGLVVLHDFYLGGLLAAARGSGAGPGPLGEELRFEGEEQLAEWVRGGLVADWVAGNLAPLNRRLLGRAAAVAVHSEWAWRRVRSITDSPVSVVPMGVPLPMAAESTPELRRRLGLPADAFVVATLGHVGPSKRVPAILEAVANLPPTLLRVTRLAVVGPMTDGDRAALVGRAEELGVAGNLLLTGRVPLADLPAYAAASDVCVQLRYPTRGETSAALLRAMAAGAACVVSDQGPMAELPDSAVVKVRSPHREIEDLTAALRRLHERPDECRALREAARRHVADRHDPARSAEHYAALIDQTIQQRSMRDATRTELAAAALAEAGAGAGLPERWARLRAAADRRHDGAFAASLPPQPPPTAAARTLWVEVTQMLRWQGNFTGMPRVVACLLQAWLDTPGLPVRFFRYADEQKIFAEVPRARVAGHLREIGSPPAGPGDATTGPIESSAHFGPNDVVFLPEWSWGDLASREQLARMKAATGFRQATLVHDVLPWRLPLYFAPWEKTTFLGWLEHSLRNDDLTVTISQHSRKDLLAFAAERGIDPPAVGVFREGDTMCGSEAEQFPDELAGRLAPGEPFVLLVSTLYARKNHWLAYQTWRRLLEQHPPASVPKLVFVGSKWRFADDLLGMIAEDSQAQNHVLVAQKVPDAGLAWLYRHCSFWVYPSFYEGWGLPIAEALAFGKYGIVSETSSMPEIGGGLLDYHDPLDQPTFQRLVERAIFDASFRAGREERIRDGYRLTRWEDSAAEVLAHFARQFGPLAGAGTWERLRAA